MGQSASYWMKGVMSHRWGSQLVSGWKVSCHTDGAVSESLDERCHVTQTGQSVSHGTGEV